MAQQYDHYWYTDIREMVTLKDMLAGSVELYADRPAFWVKEKRGAAYRPISYALLQHDVNALGTKLSAMGLAGKPVAVMGQNCYEWIATYLAVINGIGVVVPIDKELTGPEVGNLMETAECDTIFCTKEEFRKLRGLPAVKQAVVMEFYGDRAEVDQKPVSGVDDIGKYRDMLREEGEPPVQVWAWRELLAEGEVLLAEGRRDYVDTVIDPDALAVILFTSGTTGNPKGVMLCHRNITMNIMDVCRIAYITPEDKTLSLLPIHHTYECTLGMLLVLYRGASTAFCEGFKYISKNMQEVHNTVIIVVPRVLEMIYGRIQKSVAKGGKEKMFGRIMRLNRRLRRMGINVSRRIFHQIIDELGGNLRIVITGAAALSPEINRAFEDFGIIVLQGYGMTECTPLISGTPMSAPKERYQKAGSVGVPVHTGELRIINKDEDGIGEVLFRGPNVTMGYYKMPEETAEVIDQDGWLHTGDLGYMKDGWLFLTGRCKNVIVTKTGENVYPEEVEEVIGASPFVEDCMVFPYNDNGEELVGIQILPQKEELREKFERELSEEELGDFMTELIKEKNQELAVYKRIRKVFVRKEDFVRTTTRKIKRQDNMYVDERVRGCVKGDGSF